ncbi:MAG TPA: ABC transporter ATP-binding protein [Spirochaetia bacterium]|nr:ABC transporter ATP-binding protein [Spirochaetia bacterium]
MARPLLPRLAWIWGLWRERKLLIALLLALTLLSSAVAVAYPYMTKLLFDALQRQLEAGASLEEGMAEIRRLALLVLGIGAVGLVASLFPGLRSAVNAIFDYLVRRRYFGELLGKDHRFFGAFRTGDLVTRLTDDVHDFPKLSWFLCSGIFRAVESISKLGFCLSAMLLLDWRLTLLSLIPLPLLVAAFALTQDRIYDSFRRNQEAISEINSQLETSFSGARIIKAFACEATYGRFFSAALERRLGTELAAARLEIALQMIYLYVDRVMLIGVVFVGGYLTVSGRIGIGTFLAFYSYLGMLVYPILDIPQLFVSGKRAFVNIDRLEELRAFPARTPRGNKEELTSLGRLEVEGLRFAYEGRQAPAIAELSFFLERGEKLAVVGPVGSGKSSLIKLLAGLLYPSAGQVRADGRLVSCPEAGLEEASLASILAYVPQEALLFSGSIRENVAFGAPGEGREIGDSDFERAVSTAQLGEELAAFPEGADTRLGQRGTRVSGGQRQRIAIARALARSPKLLLLDDITASLDARNEERLMRALDALSRELCCVIVSHRLSTIQYADKVLFLEGGRASAFGVHEELLGSSPAYASFVRGQLSPGR